MSNRCGQFHDPHPVYKENGTHTLPRAHALQPLETGNTSAPTKPLRKLLDDPEQLFETPRTTGGTYVTGLSVLQIKRWEYHQTV